MRWKDNISMKNIKTLIVLNIILLIYSLSGIFSKSAAGEPFLSFKFIMYYSGVILLLGFYAIFWQQIIKKLPLTVAYANKAVAVIWGIVWGILFFGESISVGKCIGAIMIICGVVLFSIADNKEEKS